MGASSRPARLPLSCSITNARFSPSVPAKLIATQMMPGATMTMEGTRSSKEKLNTMTESSANTNTLLRMSFVRSSARMSFHTIAPIARHMVIVPPPT